jgi:hypothetical protein
LGLARRTLAAIRCLEGAFILGLLALVFCIHDTGPLLRNPTSDVSLTASRGNRVHALQWLIALRW